jgi:hypothetical protein
MVREANACRTRAHRSLLPREHGAYAQIAFPLLSAVCATRWHAAVGGLVLAAVTLFLAHEPALIMLGHRGARALNEDGERAWRRLIGLVAVAGAAGGLGTALMPFDAQASLALPLLLAAAVIAVVMLKKERTVGGELLVSSALASTAVPVMLSGGISPGHAFGAWLAWTVAFGVSTLSVEAVMAGARADRARTLRAWTAAIGSLALFAASFVSHWLFLAALPVAGIALVVNLSRPSPRRLREIGWSVVGASAAMAALLVPALN